MLHAVIMAGGSGTRFWPASRKLRPKQLLNLHGRRTMLQSTVDRLEGLVPSQRQHVITSQLLCDAVAEQLPELPPSHIVGEPCKRDTAPCVGLAAALVALEDPAATMVVMPSDHVIANPQEFRRAIAYAERLVDEDPTRIVTFGIRPQYPAESFGYIESGAPLGSDEQLGDLIPTFAVQQFREKPDRVTAQKYVDAGNFYWNSGIFVWRASTILESLREFEPDMTRRLDAIAGAVGQADFESVFQAEFTAIRGKSIDYAVMERYSNVIVVEAPFSWDDVGSWQALARLNESDASGNVAVGSHIGIDTRGVIVRSEANHTIVTIDVSDLIIVQTPDATLVAPKSAEERVREAVKAIEERGLDSLL